MSAILAQHLAMRLEIREEDPPEERLHPGKETIIVIENVILENITKGLIAQKRRMIVKMIRKRKQVMTSLLGNRITTLCLYLPVAIHGKLQKSRGCVNTARI